MPKVAKYWKLSRYHLLVIGVYAVSLPLLFTYFPSLHYQLSSSKPGLALGLVVATFLGFFLLNSALHLVRLKLHHVDFLRTIGIALLFSVPEEVIFRGIIQHSLQTVLSSTVEAMLLASLIFGAVHLINGATSFRLRGLNWQFASYAFLGGLPLGSLYVVTGNLLAPTLLHAFFLVFLQVFVKQPE